MFDYEKIITPNAIDAHQEMIKAEAAKEEFNRKEAERVLEEQKQALALKFMSSTKQSKSF